jgi:hypothetical protein
MCAGKIPQPSPKRAQIAYVVGRAHHGVEAELDIGVRQRVPILPFHVLAQLIANREPSALIPPSFWSSGPRPRGRHEATVRVFGDQSVAEKPAECCIRAGRSRNRIERAHGVAAGNAAGRARIRRPARKSQRAGRVTKVDAAPDICNERAAPCSKRPPAPPTPSAAAIRPSLRCVSGGFAPGRSRCPAFLSSRAADMRRALPPNAGE